MSERLWRALAFFAFSPFAPKDGLGGDRGQKDTETGANRVEMLPEGKRGPLAGRTAGRGRREWGGRE